MVSLSIDALYPPSSIPGRWGPPGVYAGARDQLFAEGAIKKLFQASNGIPRRINQLALHVLIQGAVLGIDSITSEFMTQQLHNHPLYDPSTGIRANMPSSKAPPGSAVVDENG
jgi:hypothetical protein